MFFKSKTLESIHINFLTLLVFTVFLLACDTGDSVIKESNGTFLHTYGGVNSEVASDILVQSDGDIWITGYSTSASSQKRLLLIKIDPNGTQKMINTYAFDTLSEETAGFDIESSLDGGVVVVGYTDLNGTSDPIIMNFDNEGTLLAKNRTILFGINAQASSVAVDEESNSYFVASNDVVNNSIIVSEFDQNLNELYTSFDAGSQGFDNRVTAVSIENQDTRIVYGSSNFNSGESQQLDYYIFRFDKNSKNSFDFGDFGTEDEEIGTSFLSTENNNFVLSGYTTTVDGIKNIYLVNTAVKLDNGIFNGWEVNYDNTLEIEESSWANSICETSDGDFLLAGGIMNGTQSDILILRVDRFFNLKWYKKVGSSGNNEDGHAFIEHENGSLFGSGYVDLDIGSSETILTKVFVVRTDQNGNF